MWREQSIDTLNGFLREESAAVATYLAVLDRLRQSRVRPQLIECYRSHQVRVMKLVARIRSLGGRPEQQAITAGVATVRNGMLPSAGEGEALAALEADEDRGLKLYLDHLSRLDPTSRKLMDAEVLPEQIKTHQFLSDLRLATAGASP